MATVTICDCCGSRIRAGLRVTVKEEHPHKGEQLTRLRDVCFRCGERMQLELPGPLPRYPAPVEGQN